MSTQPEARRLNLEYYRKQAKILLKAAEAGDTAARERLARHAAACDPAVPKLHDAQLTVAREQGFASWPRFRAFIMQSEVDDPALVAAFVTAALSDLAQAEALLAAHPRIAAGGFHVDLVLGNLKDAPDVVTRRGGPAQYEPLAYVCFSLFNRTGRAEALTETARVLLRHHADPNTSIILEQFPNNPLSCLYAAAGLHNNVSLARVLLEAGADPNDGESLYHSTEHPDLECMKLLLEHGARPGEANALRHILDYEHPVGVRHLLAAGANPNDANEHGVTCLHWAVWRERSAEIIAALLDAGADPQARRSDGRTAYAMAVQSGQIKTVELMDARGAATEVSDADRLLGACLSGAAIPPGITFPPDAERLLPDLAMNHRTEAVRALLAAGAPIDGRGEHGGTALHWACWQGSADLVELLLTYGPSLTIEDTSYNGTPPGWFTHGLRNCRHPAGDYPRVERLLIAAGAKLSGAGS